MSTTTVVQLDDYRTRREERLRRAVALHAADPERGAVVENLAGALTLLKADRAAMVWVDEYGPGLVHAYAVVDLVSDGPRRSFDIASLRDAWDAGIPGLVDQPDLEKGEPVVSRNGVRSQAVVSLGSDGSRAWFVVVDSLSPRSPLSREASEFLMFFAGECSSVVLHRDLPALVDDPRAESEELRRDRFAGWPVLRDIEGREDDTAANHRISCRFMVARVVRRLIDDDFAVDDEALRGQIDGVRSELERAAKAEAEAAVPAGDSEREAWERVLDAAEAQDLEGLASAVVDAGDAAESEAHYHGSSELYRCAYDLAVVSESLFWAVEALRKLGRSQRKLGDFAAARSWYGKALDIGRIEADPGQLVWVLTGLVNIERQKGKFPVARELLAEQKTYAEVAGDESLAVYHHLAMSVEKDAGNWGEAVVHGWEARERYTDATDQLFALSDLVWTFAECGANDWAEEGFEILAGQELDRSIRAMALEGLALVAARGGDREAFDHRRELADSERPELGPWLMPQCEMHRAEAHEVLGDLELAREHLKRAERAAREGDQHQVALQAEMELERLAGERKAEAAAEPPEEHDDGIRRVLQGLRDLRLAGIGG